MNELLVLDLQGDSPKKAMNPIHQRESKRENQIMHSIRESRRIKSSLALTFYPKQREQGKHHFLDPFFYEGHGVLR